VEEESRAVGTSVTKKEKKLVERRKKERSQVKKRMIKSELMLTRQKKFAVQCSS